jgi:pyridoxine 5'-phosphate synthase PdxJ
MTTNNATTLLKYAQLQMAAEAFLVNSDGTTRSGTALVEALKRGNERVSKFPDVDASDFAGSYEVVAQQPNTFTGFSGTLFRDKITGDLILSFRSTEFADDAVRDNEATNVGEIKEFGWAFGQITYAAIDAGHAVVAEINQEKRTVLEYLLSPVQTAVAEAGRER